MSIVPSNFRLLSGVASALRSLAELCESPDGRQISAAAGAIVDELMLRTEHEFYAQYAQSGRLLLAEMATGTRVRFSAEERRLIGQTLSGLETPSGSSCEFAAQSTRIDGVRRCFEKLSARLVLERDHESNAMLRRLVDWEMQLYQRSAQFKRPPAAKHAEPLTAEQLQAYLRKKFPGSQGLRVTAFNVLVGGFQKLTVLFETMDDRGVHQSNVIRGELPDRFATLELGDVRDEYEVVEIAFAAGLPVAEPLWLEPSADALGRRFMVSRKVAGINYGTAMGGDMKMPPEVMRAFVATLAQIHRTPLARHADALSRTRIGHWLQHESLAANTRANVEYWYHMLEARPRVASSAIGAMYSWLIANVPQESAEACLLHCDYGPHNVLIDAGRVSGILDWEVARIGDPAQDLTYFLQATTGQVNRDEVLACYQESGGAAVSEQRLRYFEVVAAFQQLVGCLCANALYANDGAARNVWMLPIMNWTPIPMGWTMPRIEVASAASSDEPRLDQISCRVIR